MDTKHLLISLAIAILVLLVGYYFGVSSADPAQDASDDLAEETTEAVMEESQYLEGQEAAVIESLSDDTDTEDVDDDEEDSEEAEEDNNRLLPVERTGIRYVQVTDSCDHNYENGDCVMVYASPSIESADVQRLRQGMVLRVGGTVNNNGEEWYKITFDNQHILYPERIQNEWYVRAQDVNVLYKEGNQTIQDEGAATSTTKQIVVDRSEEMLYAYEGEELFLSTPISTGLELSPTPLGTYEVFKKMPSRYMQGPIEGLAGSDYYDLPGVPWNLYFTSGGAVVHGAYWHESFGSPYSHGCVNLPPSEAQRLYRWAPLGTEVVIRE